MILLVQARRRAFLTPLLFAPELAAASDPSDGRLLIVNQVSTFDGKWKGRGIFVMKAPSLRLLRLWQHCLDCG